MCFSLLYSIIGLNWAGGPISWCHPLKLPYNVIQSIFSFSPRWCHLPLGGITSPYGKKWCHERSYAPTQTSSTQWCHLPKWRMTSHPRRLWRNECLSTPPMPLRMRPGAELSVSYYLPGKQLCILWSLLRTTITKEILNSAYINDAIFTNYKEAIDLKKFKVYSFVE